MRRKAPGGAGWSSPLAILCMIMFSLSAAAQTPTTPAGTGSPTTGPDDGGSQDEREVRLTATPTSVSFELVREPTENASFNDTVAVDFGTDDAVVDVSYAAEGTNLSFGVNLSSQLRQLVEFHDNDSNGRFDQGEQIVSSFLLAQGAEPFGNSTPTGVAAWGPFEEDNVTEGDREGRLARATAVLAIETGLPIVPPLPEAATGTFGIEWVAFGARVEHEGVEIKPAEVLARFNVTNYPYRAQDTSLAVILESESSDGLDWTDTSVASRHEVDESHVEVVTRWTDQASVDGEATTVPVTWLETGMDDHNGTTPPMETRRVYALSYPRGEQVEHALAAGAVVDLDVEDLESLAGGGEGAGIPALPWFGAAVLTGVAFTLAHHRNNRKRME